ncbi:MAG: ATP-binding protein [Desulfobacterales bacterium]|nr:ATP-binding protein [Desulfobacterales bacterium]MDJ0854189.1 ATP-binding protein [Desulfobacterales bacterium]MDJ0886994.1 ATP-binding protein [Desulfobacterales bacterium]MDJ0988963.1 ATP-binding protein [Desulfobacterales bacterium]
MAGFFTSYRGQRIQNADTTGRAMMPQAIKTADSELRQKIRWLNRYRFLFTLVLLGSTLFFHLSRYSHAINTSLIILYTAIAVLFTLSFLYAAFQRFIVREDLVAYTQIAIDSVVVTSILLVTGFFESIFVFLYLVVIIYTSILLYRRGSFIIATLCSFEYVLLVVFCYSKWFPSLASANLQSIANFQWHIVVYRTVITVFACFAVAFLSSHLAEQARRSRRELKAMGDRVRRVEKMAAVGEMGAGLAHEIKNPLASITGSIQLLREEMPFESGRDKLMQIILREADRLSALVGNFLLFARPPSGTSVPIELDSAIPETIRLVEQDRRFRNTVSIEQSGPSGLWIVMDPDHFRQILWNLLLNAVEAIDGEGGVGVSVDTTKNGHVAIRISDDGCGISEAQMQSIFDPFYTSKPHGTGLGLSIVHSILETYEGWLEVESRAGQGTHFTMKIKRIPPPTVT